ncbi:MAG: hypothetical protein ABSF95_17270 [Verrucomicrobiota bacterium]
MHHTSARIGEGGEQAKEIDRTRWWQTAAITSNSAFNAGWLASKASNCSRSESVGRTREALGCGEESDEALC